MTEKSRNIIRTVAELYSYGTDNKSVEEVTQENYERLVSKENEWDEAFKKYDEFDVIQAIRKFWRHNTDKTRPSVAKILALLSIDKEVKVKSEEVIKEAEPDYPIKRFKQDLALGICHHNLYIYQDAYRLQKSRKTALFEDLLKECCLKRCGREFEFPSNEELIENKINPAERYPLEETKGLLKSFIRNGGKL